MFFTISTTDTTVYEFLICTAASLVFGLLTAFLHMYKNRCSKHFILTLVILPAIVQAVIMLVNGNLGTGIAVMGAFSLVRFRSVPGNSREIAGIFLAMALGLATGTGYLGVAALLLAAVALITLVLLALPFLGKEEEFRDLKISVPEDLDYDGLFEEVLTKYTDSSKLIQVKTSNMGSLFELHYQIHLKKGVTTKELLDELRCRNGNLPVALHLPVTQEATSL